MYNYIIGFSLILLLMSPVAASPIYVYVEGPIYSTQPGVMGTLGQLRYQVDYTIAHAPSTEVIDQIVVCIISPGGEVYEALAIYDYLQTLRHRYKVYTVAMGVCASAGTIILQAGDVRYATNNTYLMTHAPLLMFPANTRMAKTDADGVSRSLTNINDFVMGIFARRMHTDVDSIQKYFRDTEYEMYGGWEAYKIGLVDKVIMDKAWRYFK